MTNEEILKETFKTPPGDGYNPVHSAMDLAREDEAVAFATWLEDGNFWKSEENGIRYYQSNTIKKSTKEQLYQLFKKDTNGK